MGHYDSDYEYEEQIREADELARLQKHYSQIVAKPTIYTSEQLAFLIFVHQQLDKLISLRALLNMFLKSGK